MSFQAPGIIYFSTTGHEELGFLKLLLERAREAGYRRFVNPACGALAIAHAAVQSGWPRGNVEASEVSLVPVVLGHAVTGRSIEPLGIEISEPALAGIDTADPAAVMYADMVCRYQFRAKKIVYWQEIVTDLLSRRDEVIETIAKQLEAAQAAVFGIQFFARDLWGHLESVKDDPETVIVINPPCIGGGYEKFFETGGRVKWRQPEYEFFKPATDFQKLAQLFHDSKALFVLAEEATLGDSKLEPVFGRGCTIAAKEDSGSIKTRNVYLSVNRVDEAKQLLRGFGTLRRRPIGAEPSQYPIMPADLEVTDDTPITLAELTMGQAYYYRALWTHRFAGAAGSDRGPLALVLGGYIAGVFAMSATWLVRGMIGKGASPLESRSLFMLYGMTPILEGYRLSRLLTKVAICSDTIDLNVSPMHRDRVQNVLTANFTRWAESKDMRGLMKLHSRKPIKKKYGLDEGFMLRYRAKVEDNTWQEALRWWIADEKRYRAKNKA